MKRHCHLSAKEISWKIIVVLIGWFCIGNQAKAKETTAPFSVAVKTAIPYRVGAKANPKYHSLDVYVPEGKKHFPVVFFVHGGSWVTGDKSDLGNVDVAKMFARYGVGVVSVNYRRAAWIKHPAHIEDVARAFAWTKENISAFGGQPDEIFLCGHSAGSHLISLLATDPTYLKKEGLDNKYIRGVISMSGVYKLSERNPAFLYLFGKVPGQAAPLNYVSGNLPPFLLLHAERELIYSSPKQAMEFSQALEKYGVPAKLVVIAKRDHNTILWRADNLNDPAAKAMVNFVYALALQHRLANGREPKAVAWLLREYTLLLGQFRNDYPAVESATVPASATKSNRVTGIKLALPN